MKIFIIATIVLLTSCSEAERAKHLNIGNSAKVTCYSKGIKIYEGHSTGKVEENVFSEGYYFKENESGKFINVPGDCVIVYE